MVRVAVCMPPMQQLTVAN